MDGEPYHFIDEPIDVRFHAPPGLAKSPPCPAAFTWRGKEFVIEEMLETWVDFRRRGKFARNMRSEHLRSAASRGSWGVGRFHFRVRAQDGRHFHLYYDRAPKDINDRKGYWMLLGERQV